MKTKQRTGIVAGWLIFMLVINGLSVLLYLFKQDWVSSDFPNGVSKHALYILAFICALNLVFIIWIYQWKKLGVWALMVTSVVAVFINMYNGLGIGQSLLGFLGIGILLWVLQVKRDNVSNWSELE